MSERDDTLRLVSREVVSDFVLDEEGIGAFVRGMLRQAERQSCRATVERAVRLALGEENYLRVWPSFEARVQAIVEKALR